MEVKKRKKGDRGKRGESKPPAPINGSKIFKIDGFKRATDDPNMYSPPLVTAVGHLNLIDPVTGEKVNLISNKYKRVIEKKCHINSYLTGFNLITENDTLLDKNIDTFDANKYAKLLVNVGLPYKFNFNCKSIK